MPNVSNDIMVLCELTVDDYHIRLWCLFSKVIKRSCLISTEIMKSLQIASLAAWLHGNNRGNQSIHHFDLDWNISANLKLIVVTFCTDIPCPQRINQFDRCLSPSKTKNQVKLYGQITTKSLTQAVYCIYCSSSTNTFMQTHYYEHYTW